MIIIEGPDGIGKTSLCEQLAERLRRKYGFYLTVRHMGVPKKDFHRYHGYEVNRDVIADRFHLGLWCYQFEENEYMRFVDANITQVGGIVVVFTCMDEDDPRMKGDDKFLLNSVQEANRRFRGYAGVDWRPYIEPPHVVNVDYQAELALNEWPLDHIERIEELWLKQRNTRQSLRL
jgi:hypothetical protein